MENILSRDQLIEKIVYFGDDTDYKIISNLIESPEPIYSDEDSKSEHDSNSDMDVDQEFKNENKISKQEKKENKYLYKCFTKAQNIQILLKCTSRESCRGQKEKIYFKSL